MGDKLQHSRRLDFASADEARQASVFRDRMRESVLTSDFSNNTSRVDADDDIRMHKEGLSHVRSELELLAKQLKKRSEDITDREMDLRSRQQQLKSTQLDLNDRESSLTRREKRLAEREKLVELDVQRLVADRLKLHDSTIKQDAEVIVKKYDEMLDQLGRENKRLQTTLKELVITNRTLRDQNKKLTLLVDEKERLIDEQAIQTTLLASRNISPVPTKGPRTGGRVDETASHTAQPTTEMFQQMKKLIMSQPAKLLIDAVSDAMMYEALVASFRTIDALTAMSDDFDSVSASGDVMQSTESTVLNDHDLQPRHDMHVIAVQMMDSYLGIALSFVRRPSTMRIQRHAIASLVYRSFGTLVASADGFRSRRGEFGRVCTFLIVLAGVSQSDVLEVMLDGLLSELSSSEVGGYVLFCRVACDNLADI
eukprot:jgi/Hompol1/5641/HPOL_004592-RA